MSRPVGTYLYVVAGKKGIVAPEAGDPETIGRRLAIHRTAVEHSLQGLVEDGWITREGFKVELTIPP